MWVPHTSRFCLCGSKNLPRENEAKNKEAQRFAVPLSLPRNYFGLLCDEDELCDDECELDEPLLLWPEELGLEVDPELR